VKVFVAVFAIVASAG